MRKIVAASALALVTGGALMIGGGSAGAAPAASGCDTPEVSYNQNAAALYCPGPIPGSTQFQIEINCTNGTVYGPWRTIGGGLYSAAGCDGSGTINSIEAIVN